MGACSSLSQKPLIRNLIRGKIIYSSKNKLKKHKIQVAQKLLPPMNCILFKIHGSKFKPNTKHRLNYKQSR